MRDVRLRLFPINDETPGGEGELAVTAPSMLSRYFDDPLPLREGLFHTGDLARLSADGNLYITGRTGLLIETAGRKVNPLEIEAVLTSHPGVAACLVLPMRQTETVQRLRAIIEPREGATPPSDDELRAFARERLAPHKMPRTFECRKALPRTSTGKLLRSGWETT
jgi:acyl-coenzyme A synthetase/AMP-(fatty) acid ligase